jgi:hypothetical protein
MDRHKRCMGVDSICCGSVQVPETGFCEPSSAIKCEEFVGVQHTCLLQKICTFKTVRLVLNGAPVRAALDYTPSLAVQEVAA